MIKKKMINRFTAWDSAVVQKDLVYKCNPSDSFCFPRVEKVVLNMVRMAYDIIMA